MEGHLCYAALLGALGWVRGRHRPGVRPTTGAATVTGNTSFADARDGDNNTATSTGRPTGSTSQFGNDRAVLTDIRRRIPCQRHRPRRKREVKAILDQSASDNDRKYLLHSTFENEGHQGARLTSRWAGHAYKLIEAAQTRRRAVNAPAPGRPRPCRRRVPQRQTSRNDRSTSRPPNRANQPKRRSPETTSSTGLRKYTSS